MDSTARGTPIFFRMETTTTGQRTHITDLNKKKQQNIENHSNRLYHLIERIINIHAVCAAATPDDSLLSSVYVYMAMNSEQNTHSK